MPRFAMKLSAVEFEQKFLNYRDKNIGSKKFDCYEMEEDSGIDQVIMNLVFSGVGKIQTDLAKVEFDFENYELDDSGYGDKRFMGIHTYEDLTFIGGFGGGDWEDPVYFIVYFDGKDFRGYVPKEGNTYNLKTKVAFGNGDDYDNADSPDDNPRKFNYEEIMSDIMNRIKVK